MELITDNAEELSPLQSYLNSIAIGVPQVSMISTGSITEQNSESSHPDVDPVPGKRGRKKTDPVEYQAKLEDKSKKQREEIKAC